MTVQSFELATLWAHLFKKTLWAHSFLASMKRQETLRIVEER